MSSKRTSKKAELVLDSLAILKSPKKKCPKGTRRNKKTNDCVPYTKTLRMDPTMTQIEPVIYYLISCHGQIECAYQGHYETLKIPENLEMIQKMTYAPFGCIRSSIKQEEKKWIKKFKSFKIYNTSFGLSLEEKIKMLYNQVHTSPSTYSPNIIPDIPLHNEAMGKKDGRYGSFLYKKGEPIGDIINKYYFRQPNTDQNIYIVHQKGGSLNIERIFGSEEMERYIKESKNGRFAEVLHRQGKFTTELLLDFSSFYGYKSVFIFDGACDVCVNYQGSKYRVDEVKTVGDKVKEGLIHRGGGKSKK